jgi:Fe-S-cluster containining protein
VEEKFICRRCGKCCQAFRLTEPKHEIPGFVYAGVIALSKPTLVILPWEKGIFHDAAYGKVVYDTKNKQVIVLDYCLKETSCPLQKDNSCTVYERRPVSCRIFPCPVGEPGRGGVKSAYGFCPVEISRSEFNRIFVILRHLARQGMIFVELA